MGDPSSINPHQLPRKGDRVDRYEVLASLSTGGMAAVYAVKRASIGGFDKLLAMKVMLPALASERQAVQMFLDEARLAAQIDHPNVVQVIDVGEHQGLPFLVMEYLRGQPLAAIARSGEDDPLPTGLVLAILAQAADGLHGAHETCDADGKPLGVVHRDVSPQNIFVTYDGRVAVLDFGIAAARGRLAHTRSGEIRGKLAYMAPEQITKEHDIDRRADVWALGVVGWELLAGKPLFRDADEATTMWNVINKSIPPLAAERTDIPSIADDCIMRCLKREPAERVADCDELLTAMDRAADELSPWRRKQIAVHMSKRFGEAEATEQSRLANAVASDDLDPSPDQGSGTRITAERTIPGLPKRRSSVWLAILLGVVVAALAAWRMSPAPARDDPPTSEPAAQPSEHVTASEPPASVETQSAAAVDSPADAGIFETTESVDAAGTTSTHRARPPPKPTLAPPPPPRFDNPYD